MENTRFYGFAFQPVHAGGLQSVVADFYIGLQYHFLLVLKLYGDSSLHAFLDGIGSNEGFLDFFVHLGYLIIESPISSLPHRHVETALFDLVLDVATAFFALVA